MMLTRSLEFVALPLPSAEGLGLSADVLNGSGGDAPARGAASRDRKEDVHGKAEPYRTVRRRSRKETLAQTSQL